MKRAESIQAELNELGAKILMNMPSDIPYSLPVNYFNTLSEEITDVVRINDLPEAPAAWGHHTPPYESPGSNYFEDLSATILAKVNTAPEWGKTNPFTVPQGYFEALPETIINKAKNRNAPVKKRVPLFRTMQLAASMALIFFAGFAVMKMNSVPGTKPGTVTVAAVSDTDIKNYVDANLDDFDTDLIINSLATNNTKANRAIEISDAEIKAYLDESGWN